MAENDSTLTSTIETRAGADVCMKALRALKNIDRMPQHGARSEDDAMEAWWHEKDDVVAAMLQAAGNPAGFIAGFIGTLAEYVKESECTINLDKWTPEATMTAEDKAASRIKFEEEVAASNKKIEITEEDKEQAYQEASALAKKSIDELLTSSDDFRNRCARHVASIVPVLVVETDGYSFENATMEKINHSVTAMREIIKGGEVAFAPSIYDQRHSEIIVEAFERHRHIWTDDAEMNSYIRRFISESQAHKPAMEPANI